MSNGFNLPNPQQDFSPVAPGDEKLFRQFYMGSVPNEEKTRSEGHPVFDAVPFIKIIVPGDRNTVIDTLAGPQYQRRFAREWAAFQANEVQEMSGLPVRDWPGVTRAQAEELMHMHIITVEQLASVADVYASKIMGFQDLKRKAQTYLENAKDSAAAEKLSLENKKLRDQLNSQAQELGRLSLIVEQMQANQGVPNAGNAGTGTDPNRRK
jgi:hypothetical protein